MLLYDWTFENKTIQFLFLFLCILPLHNLSHSVAGIKELLQRERPVIVLVQGLRHEMDDYQEEDGRSITRKRSSALCMADGVSTG